MRGQGRIFLRGQNYWIAYYHRGKEYRESAGSTDPKQAEKFLKARLREVGADVIGAHTFTTPKASKLTVADLVAALKADFELRGKASPQNLSVLRRVDADFGSQFVLALTAEEIDKYIEQRLADGDKPATINRATQILSQTYDLAIRRRHLTRAPYIRHLSEVGNARKGFIDPAGFEKVLAALPDADLRDFAAWAYSTGQRKGEANNLTWNMVDGDTLRIPGSICKNGKDRTIPLAGDLSEIIERRRTARSITVRGMPTTQLCDWIFHRNGQPIREFRKSWKSATRKAGCTGLLFHDFRRSGVRNLRKAGVPEIVAMQLSGHRTRAVFDRYNIVDESDVREALQKVGQYRATAAKQKVVAMS